MHGPGFEPEKTKLDLMYEALLAFLDIKRDQRPQDYMALIPYHTTATLCCRLLNVGEGYDTIAAAIKKARRIPGNGTQITSGLQIALKLIRDLQRYGAGDSGEETITRILGYSDGEDQAKCAALRNAERLKELGVLIYTLGIGSAPENLDEKFLRQIASEIDGVAQYRFLGQGDVIRQTFSSLATGMLVFEG
jgi:hypothetical protein